MPSFVFQPLLWGLLLVGVPVLIHLINMLRHRRVRWAAMEFLLQSQRRHRTWVLLTQLLLLLMRMAAIAAIVLMLAQPLLNNQLGRIFGGAKTHHIVLLDDSFSMSDRWADTSAFELATAAVRRIGEQVADQAQPQAFTLIRFSRVAGDEATRSLDLVETQAGPAFSGQLDRVLEGLQPSETAVDALPALAEAKRLCLESADAQTIVYLITDYRARQWNEPSELRRRLLELDGLGCRLHLVDCASRRRQNLAVTELRASDGTRAADVPMFAEVAVHNFGDTPARDVSVMLEQNGAPRPAVRIAEIPPGETVRERFLIHFDGAGRQRLVASLQSDGVAADNTRYLTVDVPLDVPVLLIDDEGADAAGTLAMALAPGGRVTTGIRPVVETARYLSVHPLDEYSVIYLLDVPRLDRSAVAALEEFVDAGGGLGIFLGERTRSREINDQLYRDGEGLFPAPLAGPRELLVDRLTRAPDLNVADHPIFRLLAERSAGFLDMVRVERYFGLDPDWRPAPDSGVDVIARLRGGDPLMIEKRFGEGRVVAMLSTLGPEWNNWARNNPSFVVAMLEMQSYLAQQPGGRSPHRVGQPLAVRFEPDQYEPRVRLTPPAAITDSEDGSAPAMVVDAIPTPEGQLEVDITGTDRSGFYVAELFREDGTTEARPIAVNVEADEGDLVTLGAQQLASRLPGVDYQYEQADAFQYVMGDAPGFNLAELILYVLIALLIGEQLLAWWASYHPSSRPSPTARPAPVAGGGR